MKALTPIALARHAHPHHTWGKFHHLIQRYVLMLAMGLLKLPDGSLCKRLMILVPPQHGKSTLTSQLLPPVLFNQCPSSKLILLSYSSNLAETHSGIARDHVREFMPGVLREDAKAVNHWKTTSGGYLVAAGIQGSVTGRAADGVIIDDPFKGTEDSSSPIVREKVWQTYSSVAETRLAPNGWVCLVGTPWHTDDLRGRLLETEADKWTVLRFPALAEEDDVLGRAFGEPLFPERYSLEWYEDKRRTLELRGLGHLWDALYACLPTGDSSLRAFSDPSYFDSHIWSDLPSEGLRVLALDPSKSKTGKTGDYNAIADLTLHADTHIHCRMHLNRQPLPATYEQVMAIVKQAELEGNPFRAMIVECNMFQEAVGIALQEKLPNLHIELHQTSSKQAKNARIVTSLSPLLAQHRLHFVGKTIANRLTVEQMKQIPNATNDDGPDAVELGCQLLNLLLTGNKNPPQPKILRV